MVTITVYNYWLEISVFDSFALNWLTINDNLLFVTSYLLLYYTILCKMIKDNNDCLDANVSNLVKINRIFE